MIKAHCSEARDRDLNVAKAERLDHRDRTERVLKAVDCECVGSVEKKVGKY